MIETLYSEYEGKWKDRLYNWLEDEKRKEEEIRKENQRRVELRRKIISNSVNVTNNFDDVIAAIEAVPLVELIHISEDRGDGCPRFSPPWRFSQTGTSCFVSEKDNFFYDLKERIGGNALYYIALESGLISPGEKLRGKNFWIAVDELRKLGYPIPKYIGDKEGEYDPLRWKAREVRKLFKRLDLRKVRKRRFKTCKT
ncbi:hypothetical protein DRO24_03620 [Candidatus Bathyarchaeota archaeon]|nr:MAG: hypothetical protein DRO24_03620 [Candidatus Bathyarchaeota archaeon]